MSDKYILDGKQAVKAHQVLNERIDLAARGGRGNELGHDRFDDVFLAIDQSDL